MSFEKKTFFTIIAIIIGLEVVNFFPSFLPWVLILLTIFFIYALSFILQIKPEERNLYPIFILPLVLLVEAFIIPNVIPLFSLKHLFIISFGFLLYLIIFSLNALKTHIVSYSVIIFNILTIAYLVSVLFAYIILYNFYLLFNLPIWFAMIFFGIITFLFFLFHLWKNDLLKKDDSLILSYLLTLILIEFFWVLTFMPFVALSSGFILFLIYYAYSDLFILHLKDSLTKKSLLGQIFIPSLILIFFMVSLKW